MRTLRIYFYSVFFFFFNLSICFRVFLFPISSDLSSLEAVRDSSPMLVFSAFHASKSEAWASPWEALGAWARLADRWAPVWGVWGQMSWLFPCSAVSAASEPRTSLTHTLQSYLPPSSVVRAGGHFVRTGSSVPSSHVDLPQVLLFLATRAFEAFAASSAWAFGVLNRFAHPHDGLCLSSFCGLRSSLTCAHLLSSFQTAADITCLLSSSLFFVLVGFCHFQTLTVIFNGDFLFWESRNNWLCSVLGGTLNSCISSSSFKKIFLLV